MSSISEVKVGSIIRVKVGKNLILAEVVGILENGFRVQSVSTYKKFNVPQSRVQLDGEQPAPANVVQEHPANAEQETNVQAEQPAEQEEPAVQAESTEQAEQSAEQEEPAAQADSTEQAEQPAEQEASEPETEEPTTVEVLPEDEAAEFQPSGEDEEDEYAINPAHESDKPVKRLSLLNAAVIVLKDAGPEHPMNCKEILEAILERHLWTPTDCKTPEQTLYGSIFREISTKENPRIVKSDVKGKFRIAD